MKLADKLQFQVSLVFLLYINENIFKHNLTHICYYKKESSQDIYLKKILFHIVSINEKTSTKHH